MSQISGFKTVEVDFLGSPLQPSLSPTPRILLSLMAKLKNCLPYFPGHGKVCPHRRVHGKRQQSGDDCAAGRGAVLGGGALGDVQVHAILHEELRIFAFSNFKFRECSGKITGVLSKPVNFVKCHRFTT